MMALYHVFSRYFPVPNLSSSASLCSQPDPALIVLKGAFGAKATPCVTQIVDFSNTCSLLYIALLTLSSACLTRKDFSSHLVIG